MFGRGIGVRITARLLRRFGIKVDLIGLVP